MTGTDGQTSESSEVLSKPSLRKFSAERQWMEAQERTKKSDIRIEPLTLDKKDLESTFEVQKVVNAKLIQDQKDLHLLDMVM